MYARKKEIKREKMKKDVARASLNSSITRVTLSKEAISRKATSDSDLLLNESRAKKLLQKTNLQRQTENLVSKETSTRETVEDDKGARWESQKNRFNDKHKKSIKKEQISMSLSQYDEDGLSSGVSLGEGYLPRKQPPTRERASSMIKQRTIRDSTQLRDSSTGQRYVLGPITASSLKRKEQRTSTTLSPSLTQKDCDGFVPKKSSGMQDSQDEDHPIEAAPRRQKQETLTSSESHTTDEDSLNASWTEKSKSSLDECEEGVHRPMFQKPAAQSMKKALISPKQSFSSFISGEFNPFASDSWDSDKFGSFGDFMQTQPAFIKATHSAGSRSVRKGRKPRNDDSITPDSGGLADSVRRKGILDAVLDSKVMLEEFGGEDDEVASFSSSHCISSLKSEDSLPKKKKSVAFGGVRVHTHAFELGDNPAAKTGIPLTLGWEVQDSLVFTLEEFEENNGGKLKVIPAQKRELIAKESGNSKQKILRVYQEVVNIQLDREASLDDVEAIKLQTDLDDFPKNNPTSGLSNTEKETRWKWRTMSGFSKQRLSDTSIDDKEVSKIKADDDKSTIIHVNNSKGETSKKKGKGWQILPRLGRKSQLSKVKS